MLRRLVHRVDFERMLAAPLWSRSAHFAMHHVPTAHLPPRGARSELANGELSTGLYESRPVSVDNIPADHWLGLVLPKRHARRAVTRNFLKRQVRMVFMRNAGGLPPGQWLVRLRAPFPAREFVSARSAALAQAACRELNELTRCRPR